MKNDIAKLSGCGPKTAQTLADLRNGLNLGLRYRDGMTEITAKEDAALKRAVRAIVRDAKTQGIDLDPKFLELAAKMELL